jgi:hypothetical protein
MKTGKRHNRSRKNKSTKKMRGGSGIRPFNLQDPRYVIPFNTYTGVKGADPIAPANIINARNFNLVGGSKRRGKRSKVSRRIRKRLQKGGSLLGYSKLSEIPDLFLGPRQGMTPVTAFGSTAGGVAYTQRELTGVGNRDGQNLAPNLGPGTKGLA